MFCNLNWRTRIWFIFWRFDEIENTLWDLASKKNHKVVCQSSSSMVSSSLEFSKGSQSWISYLKKIKIIILRLKTIILGLFSFFESMSPRTCNNIVLLQKQLIFSLLLLNSASHLLLYTIGWNSFWRSIYVFMNLILSRDILWEKKIQKKSLFSDGARQVLKFWYKIIVADFLILNITALFSTSA